MLHQPGTSRARTVTHIAHTANASSGPSPSFLISATHQSPFSLPALEKLVLSHQILRLLPRAKLCYPQERINMLSEWQRVVSERVEDDADPKLAPVPSSSCPTSPTRDTETKSPSWKRSRALADVDGDNSDTRQRKKRRLRLDLITSRLSRPYASPATHIISRNAVKLGVWTGRRYIGRNVFRKAAILNSMRRDKADPLTVEKIEPPKAISLKAIDERENTDILAPGIQLGQDVPPGKPLQQRTEVFTSALSPLKTNYDIFDDEDSDPDAEDGLPVSILGESDSDSDEADELFSFNYTPTEHNIDPPPKIDGSLELFCQRNRSLMGG